VDEALQLLASIMLYGQLPSSTLLANAKTRGPASDAIWGFDILVHALLLILDNRSTAR
jgi:hypothetical protein